MKEFNNFKEGDEIECVNNSGGYSSLLTIGKIYICGKICWAEDGQPMCYVVCDNDLTYESGYCWRFKKVIIIQDNEFVKMMACNERMLDLPV